MRDERAQRGLGRLGELGDVETGARARVGGEDARAAGVPDDRDAPPGGEGLVRQHLRGVEQLLERVDTDDARLSEEGVDGDVGRGERRRVRRGGARTGLRTSALDRDDGLAPRDPTREPGELARVPERLEVEEDHARVRIVLPVLQQIVAADVRLVADRDELGDADPELAGAAHQLDPQTTRLREERDRAAHGLDGRERRVHAHVRRGVHDAEAVRPDHAHAVAARGRDDGALGVLAAGTGLGEAGGDDHDAEHLLLRALFDHARNEVGRHDDQRDVDRVGNVEDARVRAHARDRHGGRVDRIHRSLEVVREQVAEQLVADRARVTARADDRDRTRRQDARRRRGFRALLACLDRRDRIVGRLDRETHADGAFLEFAVRFPPRVGEHVEHPRVVRQRVRAERRDPVRPRNDREVLEQQRPEAAALLVVLHAERDLGLVVTGAVVAGDGDDIVAELGDQGHVRVVVDRGEPLEVGRRRRGHRREEPQVQRFVAEPFVEPEEATLVVRTDRADAHRAAVRQHDIALPVRGVFGHLRNDDGAAVDRPFAQSLVRKRGVVEAEPLHVGAQLPRARARGPR